MFLLVLSYYAYKSLKKLQSQWGDQGASSRPAVALLYSFALWSRHDWPSVFHKVIDENRPRSWNKADITHFKVNTHICIFTRQKTQKDEVSRLLRHSSTCHLQSCCQNPEASSMCLWESIAYDVPAQNKSRLESILLTANGKYLARKSILIKYRRLTNKNLFHRSRNLKRPTRTRFQ